MGPAYSTGILEALKLAQVEARRLKNDFLGAEHLLVGLLELGDGAAVSALKDLGLTPETLRREIDRRCRPSTTILYHFGIPYTPRAKRIMEIARIEAKARGDKRVEVEHLWLGLLNEGEGRPAEIFNFFDVNIGELRTKILAEIKSISSSVDDEPQPR